MDIRKYILLTLSHAEAGSRSHYTPHFVVSKCRTLFNCESVILAKELHKEKGYHYHIGILNNSASRRTATRVFRESFVEFEGSQLNVSFHKSWTTICAYILKQDKNPFCWGTTKEECFERLKRKKIRNKGLDVIQRLKSCSTWKEVLEDSQLGPKVSRYYSSMKQTYMDLKGVEKLPPLQERLREYLSVVEKERELEAYPLKKLKSRRETYLWLVENLETTRPVRTPQLFILGPPKSGKTSFLDGLKEVLSVYEMSSRKDDFSEASNESDLWILDEFEVNSMSPAVLNRVVDGQKCRLDSKYGRIFVKEKNVPIIIASHLYPRYDSRIRQKAFDSRVKYTKFKEGEYLNMDRFIKTLYKSLEARSLLRVGSFECQEN